MVAHKVSAGIIFYLFLTLYISPWLIPHLSSQTFCMYYYKYNTLCDVSDEKIRRYGMESKIGLLWDLKSRRIRGDTLFIICRVTINLSFLIRIFNILAWKIGNILGKSLFKKYGHQNLLQNKGFDFCRGPGGIISIFL